MHTHHQVGHPGGIVEPEVVDGGEVRGQGPPGCILVCADGPEGLAGGQAHLLLHLSGETLGGGGACNKDISFLTSVMKPCGEGGGVAGTSPS